jgi:hypothetical protein
MSSEEKVRHEGARRVPRQGRGATERQWQATRPEGTGSCARATRDTSRGGARSERRGGSQKAREREEPKIGGERREAPEPAGRGRADEAARKRERGWSNERALPEGQTAGHLSLSVSVVVVMPSKGTEANSPPEAEDTSGGCANDAYGSRAGKPADPGREAQHGAAVAGDHGRGGGAGAGQECARAAEAVRFRDLPGGASRERIVEGPGSGTGAVDRGPPQDGGGACVRVGPPPGGPVKGDEEGAAAPGFHKVGRGGGAQHAAAVQVGDRRKLQPKESARRTLTEVPSHVSHVPAPNETGNRQRQRGDHWPGANGQPKK